MEMAELMKLQEINLLKQRSKYVLWYNRNFRPILTLQELLPIMENLGFVTAMRKETTVFEGLEVPWIEFKYCGSIAEPWWPSNLRSRTPPTPQLPFHYIDGLHLYTYIAFLEAVNYYLGLFSDDVFHVRGIPANLGDPDLPHWTYAEQCEYLVRRRGTLDPDLLNIYRIQSAACYMSDQAFPVKVQPIAPDPDKITMVAIDDIVVDTVTDHQDKNSNRPGDGEGKEP